MLYISHLPVFVHFNLLSYQIHLLHKILPHELSSFLGSFNLFGKVEDFFVCDIDAADMYGGYMA